MGKVIEVNGPIVRAHLPGSSNGGQVKIGSIGLVGEIIALDHDEAIVQVYEPTESLRPGDTVEDIGYPLSVELGPGLVGNIFDGVQRPLVRISNEHGDFIPRGIHLPSLDREKLWTFTPDEKIEPEQTIEPGDILGTVDETKIITHSILVPPDVTGELIEIAPAGQYTNDNIIARVRLDDGNIRKLKLFHRWPVRIPRPYSRRTKSLKPLMTGQRILDTFFPVLKGGKAAVPGPFGAGKTIIQQQIARWADADLVIYVGCGERGNELVDILHSFPELTDPHTGYSLMERTLIIANTSNMPVVAREASIYVGVTIAEYFRDQGLEVVVLSDSTSRWAEALREVGGRLGHMPVEEGYPAYLATRLSAFYERAGRVRALSGKTGSVTLIGSVSPPGGDFSEPVTTHTKEIIQTFWALSKELADARHYPSIDWNNSFSEHIDEAAKWWSKNVDVTWQTKRGEAMALLAQESELSRIVNLVGPEALSSAQRWAMEGAALIREAVLQQNALEEADSYASAEKQFALLDIALSIYEKGADLINLGVPVQRLVGMSILGTVRRLKSKYASEQIDEILEFKSKISEEFSNIQKEYKKTEEAAASS